MLIRVTLICLFVSVLGQDDDHSGHGLEDHDHLQEDGAKDQSHGPSEPYMDDTGRICQDKVEMMEDVEFENQIHCRVQMQKLCHFINSPTARTADEEQACHTMYHKECQTVYRPQMTKVNVQVCPEGDDEKIEPSERKQRTNDEEDDINSVVMDVRPSPPGMVQSSNCVNGRRKICVTKYETECSTEMVAVEMLEDHPNCRVEMIPKCNSVGDDCKNVPAMRCRIEQRTVKKTKPETRCQRMPREFCHKEDCKEVEETNEDGANSTDLTLKPQCYFRQQIVNEIVPEEKCSYRPERVCHPVGNSERTVRALDPTSGNADQINPVEPRRRVCEMVPHEMCENKKMNPKRVLKPMKKKFCRFPRPHSSYDRRIMKKMSLDFQHEP